MLNCQLVCLYPNCLDLLLSNDISLFHLLFSSPISCAMDVTQFPFDRQTCKFVFNSWTHDLSEMDLVPEDKPHIDETYINSTEWELVSITKQRRETKYTCCPHPFVDIMFTMHLKRRPSYYIYNIVIPCVVQMLIILFTFLLPAESGERIGEHFIEAM